MSVIWMPSFVEHKLTYKSKSIGEDRHILHLFCNSNDFGFAVQRSVTKCTTEKVADENSNIWICTMDSSALSSKSVCVIAVSRYRRFYVNQFTAARNETRNYDGSLVTRHTHTHRHGEFECQRHECEFRTVKQLNSSNKWRSSFFFSFFLLLNFSLIRNRLNHMSSGYSCDEIMFFEHRCRRRIFECTFRRMLNIPSIAEKIAGVCARLRELSKYILAF